MWLSQPLLRRKMRRRGVAEPGYLLKVEERFGHYDLPPETGTGFVWIHAVSLGETRTSAILLAALREALPGMRLLLTHGTATGQAEGKALLRPGDVQVWQPWDSAGATRRFLAQFKPRIGLLMETEIWPNLVAHCAAAGVPLVLVNARLSAKSLHQAEQFAALARPAYGGLAAVWAQSEDDAMRLRALGAPVKGVLGNLKFDASPDPAKLQTGRDWCRTWREATGRPVVLFASAREGEEIQLLQSLKRFRLLKQKDPAVGAMKLGVNEVQWLIVPRHPQRFDQVAALIEAEGFSLSRRSHWRDSPAPAEVWLGDSLGEMALYYGLGEVALLGGSFEPLGGQNLIEAAACGCPVLMGPSTFNFSEAAALAEAAGAARRVADMDAAVQAALDLLNDPAALAEAAAAGPRFAGAHKGAARKTAAAVAALVQE
ncbi:3-deoxy-D-manno-octulosonic acid transferase [Rhodoferax koreense]|uniref:3-deoxy-D-manno-octulosonic acid transferase n=1 Tax=Rhodoferax koreensis TaxID=1842727 RepID=A0A1P8K3X0_9BURK|nr:3-deoxy-D-manno-octulosonic acid transferase [Rhodoferax koreense]APW40699.1 3-deoxy-D-manno-octulosonic acid transferase [Rhodoferax koreense]